MNPSQRTKEKHDKSADYYIWRHEMPTFALKTFSWKKKKKTLRRLEWGELLMGLALRDLY